MDTRINEIDLTRAGIISVHRTLSSEETAWQVDYEIGGVMYRVKGSALYGRPHGNDSDIILALQTLFFRLGCPEHNCVTVMPAALLALSSASDNAFYYTKLREGLLRLSGVRWGMTRSQWNAKQNKHVGTTEVTGLISDLSVVDEGSGRTRPFDDRSVNERSPITVKFTEAFASSIRSGLFQLLDGGLLAQLGNPTSRSLYRILQAHRIQRDGSLAHQFTLPLKDWLAACGLERERLDNAKRTLDFAHQRLIEEGYLLGCEFTGRGRTGTVSYTFASAPRPELTELLVARGVSRPVAESLSSDAPERVKPALQVIDERLSGGWKPKSLPATVVDAVRNPVKWGYGDAPKSVRPAQKVSAEPSELAHAPVETAQVFLKVRLKRSASSHAVAALQGLDADQLGQVITMLKSSDHDVIQQVERYLGVPL